MSLFNVQEISLIYGSYLPLLPFYRTCASLIIASVSFKTNVHHFVLYTLDLIRNINYPVRFVAI